MKAFQPMPSSGSINYSLSVTTSSARVAISGGGPDVRVVNETAQGAFVRFTDSAGNATTSDMFIPGGAVEVYNIPDPTGGLHTHIAAITSTGSTTLRFTSGRGI